MEEPMVRIDRYDNADDIIGKVNDALRWYGFQFKYKEQDDRESISLDLVTDKGATKGGVPGAWLEPCRKCKGPQVVMESGSVNGGTVSACPWCLLDQRDQ